MSESRTTVVLTNDDGIGAPGILALEEAVLALGLGPYRVIAPAGACSGCGHRVTTHEPIEITHLDERHTAIAGTPADCARLAIHHLAPDVRLILSGINAGGNLGTDTFHSGTVAAVREGATFGVAGIALSHYIARGRTIDWSIAIKLVLPALRLILDRPWQPGTFWNVNLPHLERPEAIPPIVDCPVDPSPHPLNYRIDGDRALYSGNYQNRPRVEGADISVCFGGSIAVSPISIAGPGVIVGEPRPSGRLVDFCTEQNARKDLRFHLADGRSSMP